MVDTPLSLPSKPPKAIGSQQRRFATLRSVAALIMREMSATYGRSPGGYLWAILEPIGGVALLSIVFSLGFRSPPLGTNFAIFYATGVLPFLMFMDISNKTSRAIHFSRNLLVYPSVTLADALMARIILNTLTQLTVNYIVITGILLLFETRTSLDLPQIALCYAMIFVLSVGVGIMNCLLIGLFPAWSQIWSILTRPLLLVSGVIFLYDRVPEPYRSYLWYNPLVHIVGQMRSAFYPYYQAEYVVVGYTFGFGMVLAALGLVFLNRYSRDILHY